jgi:hypothetical protein
LQSTALPLGHIAFFSQERTIYFIILHQNIFCKVFSLTCEFGK